MNLTTHSNNLQALSAAAPEEQTPIRATDVGERHQHRFSFQNATLSKYKTLHGRTTAPLIVTDAL